MKMAIGDPRLLSQNRLGKMSKTEKDRSVRVTEQFLRDHYGEVLAAAREGLLLIKPKERTTPRREEVIENVRAYVSQIDGLAQPRWAGSVGKVWEAIFGEKALVDLLMPGPKMRKFRDFNKYSVMRLVGVLRSHGVYDECVNDSQLCALLEHTTKDSAYRSYIGLGLESRELRRLLVGLLDALTV